MPAENTSKEIVVGVDPRLVPNTHLSHAELSEQLSLMPRVIGGPMDRISNRWFRPLLKVTLQDQEGQESEWLYFVEKSFLLDFILPIYWASIRGYKDGVPVNPQGIPIDRYGRDLRAPDAEKEDIFNIERAAMKWFRGLFMKVLESRGNKVVPSEEGIDF